MHPVDLAVIVVWLVGNLVVGLWLKRRGSESTEAYFVSGRSLPWWLAGTSMVATTFASDTPLVVSGWVASFGIAENWVWWTAGLSGVMTVFLFSKFWRRAGVVTDAELVEVRYGGRSARVLRGVNAAWFGVFMNLLVIAWVNRAMTKIMAVVLHLEPTDVVLGMPAEVAIVLALFVLTLVYTGVSGLWGVVVTDAIQFAGAMFGCIVMAVVAWNAAGGLAGIQEGFARHGFDWERTVSLVPRFDGDPTGPFAKFLVLLLVVWWADKGVDGGGYLAQRMLAARDERHARWGYLWFLVAHLCLRPWPWIVVGLAGMAMLGPVADPEKYYPMMIVKLLPVGLFGLMVAAFFAAFMSTISTQLNWGASLIVNDLYRRFWVRGKPDKHYLLASQAAVVVLAIVGAVVSFLITDIGMAWKLVISVIAGIGSVYISRWFWWRVQAVSEMAAMFTAMACTFLFSALASHHPALVEPGVEPWAFLAGVRPALLDFPFSAAITALISIPIWVTVTLVARPPDREHLLRFYEKVRPGGRGWRAIAGHLPGFEKDGPTWATLGGMVGAVAGIYGVLLSIGWILLGRWGYASAGIAVAVVGAVIGARQIAVESRTWLKDR
jgi:Na+/proline symporter